MRALLLAFLFVTSFVSCQEIATIRTVAFYNLENLFDTVNDETINDEASPIMEITVDREKVYTEKVENMAKVLSEIGVKETTHLPDIIGVAEVENRQVLEDLIQNKQLTSVNYDIIHYNSPDLRGIDVALIYNADVFVPTNHETFELKLWDENGARIYTRDQLLVSGYLDGELIHFIVNHWPSRRGGEEVSSHLREKAAFLTTQIVEKIRSTDKKAKIIIMGDLNDDPINASVKKVIGAKGRKADVKKNGFYNPMEDMFRRGQHTLVYRDKGNMFDQLIYSKPLLSPSKNTDGYKVVKTNVFKPTYLVTQKGKYKNYPFRSFAGNNFIGGYSDHYPVYLLLQKK